MRNNTKISYFLKIGLFIGIILLFCLFGLFVVAKGDHPCSSNSRLEYPSLKTISSFDVFCGYVKCRGEKPQWYCPRGDNLSEPNNGGSEPSSSSCECSSGPCCDGCDYKPSTSICDFKIETLYSCPWGSGCGANVAKKTRTRFKYCSGKSDECTEEWSGWSNWSSWRVADSCGSNEVCRTGNSQCQYSSSCVTCTPKPEPESCLECESFNALMVSLSAKKEENSGEWEEEIKARSGEKITFLLVIANSSQEDFDNISLKVELPSEIIYKDDLKIGEESSEENITESFYIDSLSGGAMTTVVFKGEVSLEIEEGEKSVTASANKEDLSVSDSVKVVFEKSPEPSPAAAAVSAAGFSLGGLLKKWYFWVLLILGIIVVFYFIISKNK